MAKIVEKALIAKKIGMTRVVSADGEMIPVTVLKVEDQKVTKILTPERDGYHGFQVGFREKAAKNLTKADLGRLSKSGVSESFSDFREFRTNGPLDHIALGASLSVDLFAEIAAVDVTGLNKGRGYQGTVKRHGSRIGRMTHGSRFHRRPGSLGMRSTPGRVFKNKKMPGHMGCEQVTIQNLKVVKVDAENNLIAVKGSVPGHQEAYLEIRPTRLDK